MEFERNSQPKYNVSYTHPDSSQRRIKDHEDDSDVIDTNMVSVDQQASSNKLEVEKNDIKDSKDIDNNKILSRSENKMVNLIINCYYYDLGSNKIVEVISKITILLLSLIVIPRDEQKKADVCRRMWAAVVCDKPDTQFWKLKYSPVMQAFASRFGRDMVMATKNQYEEDRGLRRSIALLSDEEFDNLYP